MNLIVDANILFAALIKEGKTIELLLDEDISLFAPEFLLEEFNKYRLEILKKTLRSEKEFQDIYSSLISIITIISTKDLKIYLTKAQAISPDPDDVPYFALALKLGCGIWSNDALLKKQHAIKIHSTTDIMKMK